ncbi:MAG: primosomal protein N' [Myxococcota bacterium]
MAELSSTQTLLFAPDEKPAGSVVTVAVLAPIHHPLSYRVPEGWTPPPPGTRVLCPLGNREVTGVVLPERAPPSDTDGLKPISEILDSEPLWSPDLMDTVRFCADYYLAPVGEVARAALPPGLAPRSVRQWRITIAGRMALHSPDVTGLQPADTAVLQMLEDKPRTALALHHALKVSPGRMARLAAKGLVADEKEVTGRGRAPVEVFWHPVPETSSPVPARAKALVAVDAFLRANGATSQADLNARFPQAARHLQRLETLGRVRKEERAATLQDPYASFPSPAAPDESQLTGAQRSAIAQIRAAMDERTFRAFLLQGVTGSGKTEVYLRAIAHVRALGRTALVLVPEIALTPALAARFRGRVPGGVAILHSGLSQSERRAAYDAARHGRVGAVLGARSAVFAPLWNLGLVVVDEEHDGSFKQDESPRYQGRDLALYRAKAAGAPCVLGSATPSLESVHGVRTGRLRELRLDERPSNRPLPRVELVDLRRKRHDGTDEKPKAEQKPITVGSKVPILSERLKDAMKDTLARGEQALIFLNRRGYSSAVLCTDCGLALQCPNCAVALTHHAPRTVLDEKAQRPAGFMRCHYCDHREAVPESCPSCHAPTLFPLGLGVQRVEAEVAAQFPLARIGRLDRDAVKAKGALERTLKAFAARKLDVLVGTQMLAKGHDYPGVTLVGVVAADMSLRLPDWRAAERTVQILTQVAGRAGRGDAPGLVIVQTYCPEHEALTYSARHDVRGFAAVELQVRKDLGYPPFSRLCLLRFESPHEEEAVQLAQHVAALLRQSLVGAASEARVLGPAPAPLARLKGIWRYQVLVKAPSAASRSQVLAALRRDPVRPKGEARLIVDVDPGAVL